MYSKRLSRRALPARGSAFGIVVAICGSALLSSVHCNNARADTIAYYRFETGPAGAVATSIVDSSGNNLNGTILLGAPTYNVNVPVNPIPQTGAANNFSMNFGSSDGASFAYPFPFQTQTDATLELWVNPSSGLGDAGFMWTTVGGGDTNRFNIYVYPRSAAGIPGSACIDYREPSGPLHLLGCSNVVIPPNQWSYLAYVKHGNVYSIYVNNSVTGNVTMLTSQVTDNAPNLPNSPGWTMNGRLITQPSSCCQYSGLLDEIRLSDKALNPSEFLVSIPPPALRVMPATNIAASGNFGGPFTPSSFSYQLSSTYSSVGFSISGIPTWLNANFTSGTATTSPLTVTFTLTNVSTLHHGTYSDTIAFTNTTNSKGSTFRTAILMINPDKPECKDGGWQTFTSAPGPFKNQGQCVSYFERNDRDRDDRRDDRERELERDDDR